MAEWTHTVPRSYWQRGCDDAKCGKPYFPPTSEAEWEGYRKGYEFGRTLNQTRPAGVNPSAEPRENDRG